MTPDNSSKQLLETTLDKAIAQIFVRCHMGLADWDLNDFLRQALQDPACLDKIKDILKHYDRTIEIARSSNVNIDTKYDYLYKIK